MVEAKLEALVQRLEAAVARQEALAGGAGGATQASQGGSGPGGSPLAKAYAKIVTPLIEAVRAKTVACCNDYVTNVTNLYLQLVVMQGQVLTTMDRFSKPADTKFLLAPLGKAFEEGEKVKRDRKSPINLVSVICDSMQLLQYPAFEETKMLVDTIPEFYDQISFSGNKILRADVAKDVDWYKAVMELNSAIKELILENFDKVNSWSGSEDGSGAADYFASVTTPDKLNDFSSLEGSGPSAAAPAQAKAAPASSASSSALASEFSTLMQPLVDQLKTASSALANETVTFVTNSFAEAIDLQKATMATMQAFMKPTDVKFLTTESKVVQSIQEAEARGFKDRKSPRDVISCYKDALQLCFWNTTPGNDMLADYMDEIESQVLFNANRIRKKGSDAEKAWVEIFISLLTAWKNFVKERRETICDWTGKQPGTGAKAFFESQTTGSATTSAASTPAPEEKKTPTPAAQAAPVKPAAPAKKAPAAPVRNKQAGCWIVENFQNEELLFSEEEVDRSTSFRIFNCNKCKIVIEGKCQNINIQSCKSTKFYLDQVVAQVQLFKCQAMEVRPKRQMPMIDIEGCTQTHVYLNDATIGTKFSTSCTRSTIIFYPKEEGQSEEQLQDLENWITAPIAEVFTTVVGADRKVFTEGYMEDD